jgi:hypothetical protein
MPRTPPDNLQESYWNNINNRRVFILTLLLTFMGLVGIFAAMALGERADDNGMFGILAYLVYIFVLPLFLAEYISTDGYLLLIGMFLNSIIYGLAIDFILYKFTLGRRASIK